MTANDILAQFLIAIVVTPALDFAFAYVDRKELRRLLAVAVAIVAGVIGAWLFGDMSRDVVVTNTLAMYGQIQAIYQISRISGASARVREAGWRQRGGDYPDLPF